MMAMKSNPPVTAPEFVDVAFLTAKRAHLPIDDPSTYLTLEELSTALAKAIGGERTPEAAAGLAGFERQEAFTRGRLAGLRTMGSAVVGPDLVRLVKSPE